MYYSINSGIKSLTITYINELAMQLFAISVYCIREARDLIGGTERFIKN